MPSLYIKKNLPIANFCRLPSFAFKYIEKLSSRILQEPQQTTNYLGICQF